MLEAIIPYVNGKIEALEMFQKIHGLCELITKDGKTYPAEYCNNEYKQVSDFDKFKGVVYHRLNGDIVTTELDEEETVSCDPFYSREFPMIGVFVINKKHLKGIGNDAYLEGKIANAISNTIAGRSSKALIIELGADNVSIEINNLIIDRNKIFDSEYEGIENFFRYEFLYVAIEYSIIVTGANSCFNNNPCGASNLSRDYSNDYS